MKTSTIRAAWISRLAMSTVLMARLAQGDGLSFIASRDFATGHQSKSVVVGDFDGDGIADLAVSNGLTNDVSIFLGTGDGNFRLGRSLDVGTNPSSVAVGDFNRDGMQDLAVANNWSNDVWILLGRGDGSFQLPLTFAVGTQPVFVAVGDFNADGVQDLAVANDGSNSVSILLGDGEGSFQAGPRLVTGAHPSSIAVGDFNRDGAQDIAVTNMGVFPGNIGSIDVFIANGDGSFQTRSNYPVGRGPRAVAVLDSNGDGVQDLVVANYGYYRFMGEGYVHIPDQTLSLLVGRGDGTFELAEPIQVEPGPFSLVIGDFNGDGLQDLAMTHSTWNVSVLLSNGDRTFQTTPSFFGVRDPTCAALGDFNGDGVLDLAVTSGFFDSWSSSKVSVFLGKGDGSFLAAPRYHVQDYSSSVAVADFNGDGALDLAVGTFDISEYTVSLILGNGDGTFQTPRLVRAGPNIALFIAAADFNGDGVPDLAVLNQGRIDVAVVLGNGDGSFQVPRTFPIGYEPRSIRVADLNGDGALDLVVGRASTNFVSVLLGNGDGTFQTAREVFAGAAPASVAIGDLNGDGVLDLVAAAYDLRVVS